MPRVLSVLETDGYVVGSNNGPSGLHVLANGSWEHRGWRNIRSFSVARDDAVGAILLACGNGLLRSVDNGVSWRVESDWRVTEVLDVLPGPQAGGALLATAHGAWMWRGPHKLTHAAAQDATHDSADGSTNGSTVKPLDNHGTDDTWLRVNDGLDSTFVTQLARLEGGYAAATENGLYALYLAAGKPLRWTHVGLTTPVRAVHISGDERRWIAGLERRGIALSSDGGTTWSYPLAADSIYAIAAHPDDENAMVAGGLSGTLWFSTDGGRSWRNAGQPGGGDAIHSLAFEDEASLTALCGCGKTGLHRYDPARKNYRDHALDKAFVSKILI